MILHLLHGCEECSLTLLPYLPRAVPDRGPSEAPLPFPPKAYDAPIDRAFAAVLRPRAPGRRLEESKREALALLLAGGLEALADAPADVTGLPLFEALLERSWALRHDDPPQMVQLARAAALLADGLNEGEIGARKVADLRCRAWTELANAYRVADELDPADNALGQAIEHFLQGTRTSSSWLASSPYSPLSSRPAATSIWRARRWISCMAIYRRHGDIHLAGRSLIMQGIFAGYAGDAERAILNFEQGLSMIDEARDPGLVFSALAGSGLVPRRLRPLPEGAADPLGAPAPRPRPRRAAWTS